MKITSEKRGDTFAELLSMSFETVMHKLKQNRFSPAGMPWSEILETELEKVESAVSSENLKTGFLFRIYAVADMLLSEDPAWVESRTGKEWISEITGLLNGSAADFTWSFFPSLVADDSNAFIRIIFCGIKINDKKELTIPDWAERMFDQSFTDSAYKALHLLSDQTSYKNISLCFFPVSEPVDNSIFCGESAGLSFYLCGRLLLENRRWPLRLAVTGRLEDKSIAEIGYLTEKINTAEKNGIKVFIYPSSNMPPHQKLKGSMTVFSTDSLEHAYLICNMASNDKVKYHRTYDYISTAEKFAALCQNLPDEDILSFKGHLCHLVREIAESQDLSEQFLENVEHMIKEARFGVVSLLADMFNSATEASEWLNPVFDMRWSTINLELANHCGNVKGTKIWIEKADSVIKKALKQKKGREIRPWLKTHHFIGTYHNNYDFRPESMRSFEELVIAQDRSFIEETKGIKEAEDHTLGAMYGTLAQHYGFCGPSFLSDLMRCAKRAMELFGGMYNNTPSEDSKNDFLRQYNYMTYAFLDAKNMKEAESHLLLYLEQKSVESAIDIIDSLSEWEMALLARFMADYDNRNTVMKFVDSVRQKIKERVLFKHPWQLWCHNMARCAFKSDNIELAKDFAFMGLDICESEKSGDTIKAMALLPLSFLLGTGLAANKEVEPHYKKAASTAVSFESGHFEAIKNTDSNTGLGMIFKSPGDFFPFTYR